MIIVFMDVGGHRIRVHQFVEQNTRVVKSVEDINI